MQLVSVVAAKQKLNTEQISARNALESEAHWRGLQSAFKAI